MIDGYCLSVLVLRDSVELKRRPWWNFFASDNLVIVKNWARESFILSDEEAKLFTDDYTGDATKTLILKLIGGDELGNLTLEQGEPTPQYIKTTPHRAEGPLMETGHHNLLINSDSFLTEKWRSER